MSLARLASAQWTGASHSIDTLRDSWMTSLTALNTSTAWGTQYRAIYVPIRVPIRVTVLELGVVTSNTATGNIDIGIYDAVGTRIVSTGSTAKSATLAVQAVDVTDTVIGPGLYYLAVNNDTTTDTFYCVSDAAPIAAAYGCLTQTLEAVTLPATAAWAVDQALAFVPIISALLVTEVS